MKTGKTVKRKAAVKKVVKKLTSNEKPLPSLLEPLDGIENLSAVHKLERKRRMLEALRKHMGTVLYACNDANIARRTHYVWMAEDPEYRQCVEEINEGCGDFLERKMLEAVNEKQPAVMIFLARTKWRHRGYQEVTRSEVANAQGEEFRLSGNLTLEETRRELPPDAIKAIVGEIIKDSTKASAALDRLKES